MSMKDFILAMVVPRPIAHEVMGESTLVLV